MYICIFATGIYFPRNPTFGVRPGRWGLDGSSPTSCTSAWISFLRWLPRDVLRWIPVDVLGDIPLLSSLEANLKTAQHTRWFPTPKWYFKGEAWAHREKAMRWGHLGSFTLEGSTSKDSEDPTEFASATFFIPFLFAFYKYFLGSGLVVEHIYDNR